MKSKPVNETMSWFAGLARIASSTCLTTLSVRSSVAPSGRITALMKKPWSSSGTRLPGVTRHSPTVIATMPANRSTATMPRRSMKTTPSV
jgi:hypothetical protein